VLYRQKWPQPVDIFGGKGQIIASKLL